MNYYDNYYYYITYVKSLNRKKLKRKNKDFIYYEQHHIIPKCAGGIDEKNNLVLLTAREHFLAHYLLVKIYQNTPHYGKLSLAFFQFTCRTNKHGQQERNYNSKLYDYCKKNLDLSLSEERKKKISNTRIKNKIGSGEKNSFYGKKHSTESIQRMSETHKKIVCSENYTNPWSRPRTLEEKERLSQLKKGIHLSQKSIDNIKSGIQNSPSLINMKTANIGRHWYTNGIQNIFLKKDENIPEGYVKGRTLT